MKACVDTFGSAQSIGLACGVVIQPAWSKLTDTVVVHLRGVTQATVDPCPGLSSLVSRLRIELVPALMRPAFSRRPAFGGGSDVAVEKQLDLRLPGVAVDHIGKLAGERGQPRLF
ncbi:hypothetical protein D3C77_494050 [compost metagenome]